MSALKAKFNRRRFLATSAGSVGAIISLHHTVAAQEQENEPNLTWHNPEWWGVEGRGWEDQPRQRYYDRFPAKAEGVVRDEVWNLSRHSAGMMVRFETDASEIHVRYRLLNERVAMSHMPATGVSGVDLYGKDASGTWRWIAVSRPEGQIVEAKLIGGVEGKPREYTLYLPLYNGIDSLSIGVNVGASFSGLPPRSEKPIVFYGTSITHGACASRPGMPHPAILQRWLGRPVMNLGFSGNGRMESEVGALLVELDPAVYVIDCLPNMSPEQVAERAAPLVRQIRAVREETPIILVEDRTFTNAWILTERQEQHARRRAELRKAYETLRAEGIGGLYYVEGEPLLGDDSEGATDGSHPSDLGFMRQAQVLLPVLRKALGQG